MELTGDDCESVAVQFIEHRFGDEQYAATDRSHFIDIVRGVPRQQAAIDSSIQRVLSSGWRLKRIDTTLRAILRAAVYELVAHKEIPAPAVIDEYVEVSHAFFQGDEPAFVNAALDKIARDKRESEFALPDDER